MGIIGVESFCCGAFGLERGCKIIAVVSMAFSALLFFLSISQNSLKEAHAAYLLLALTLLLVYGVVERMKTVVILYLLLRAVALVVVLVEIMRNLAEMQVFNEEKILVVALEAGDFVMTLYFWLVVFSFCRSMDAMEPLLDPFIHHPQQQQQQNMRYVEDNRAEYFQQRKQRFDATNYDTTDSAPFGRMSHAGSALRLSPAPPTTSTTTTNTSSPSTTMRVQTNPFIDN